MKFRSTILVAIIIAGATYTTTFASMASGSVVIGNKAVSLEYANMEVNATEMTAAVAAGGSIYVKDFEGIWIDNITGKAVDVSVIPDVVYKSANKKINYNARDIEQLSTTPVVDDVTINTTKLTAKQIINKYGNAVVYVEVSDKDHNVTVSGSGFIVKSTGVLVTNFHVIKGSSYATVTLQNGSKYDVKSVLNYNEKQDIAILQLSNATNLTTVNLGNSDTVEVGDNVTAIGSPGGYMNTLSKGIISGINRENDRGKDIQTTASITHGSSGGPLFNRYGNVIGINYSGFESAGDIGFVIPINEINSLLNTTNEKTLIQINGQ
ncbi:MULTISPECIES: S1C family serine protease [Clostridium]|uniref:Trypsin-like peptidase domain-containing protein n=1 Tax=Clostridium frigoriphilum TaxID=443253 RepID=A0ABU7UVJ0_9CLOT|nr:trypsin-like peptidase domain-containing protein [Clostridium sp. DSM 17811]MBU3099437.1 trypsin-like peptidase domain-containing protein [Clostridium sp. DSM 17811]